ncbi:Glucanosyltransferase-domain-containing protein [Mycena galopus ATCC 62051]|nr:Glucanosyltransferase-domain-containing protein [Mycena galopus ATCC 62051]
MRNFAAATTALLFLALTAGALPKVSRVGKYLYDENGNRFFIKGIAYQTQGTVISGPDNPLNQPSTFVDNLADETACLRDIPILQQLSVNSIRAYSANSSLNHDSCMQALSSAGIYVILDLTLPLNGSIDTTLPAWSTNILDQYLRTIDAFAKYDNVLAYNIGNEVITPSATQSAPFIVAAARDIRAYLNSISSSALVGYAAIDGPSSFVVNEANFLACSASAEIDLFGLNNYEWCGNASTTTYNTVNTEFANYGVAAYFSEFGSENCAPLTRVWTEVPVMFSEPMTNVWSGGMAFSYFSDISKGANFGMATVSADNTTIVTNADFANLAAMYKAVTFVATPAQGTAPTPTLPTCPKSNPPGWNASTTLPQTPDDAACGCLESALSCLFSPPTPNYMDLVGELIGVACGLVATAGGTCDDISSDGVAGTYGRLAMCDPTIKLSYVMSQYFELNHYVNVACSFDGNGTVNANAPTGILATAAASSCIPSATVFTPSAPPVLIPGTGAKSSSNSNSGSGNSPGGTTSSGMPAIIISRGLLTGMTAAVGCVIGGMIRTLCW